MGRININSLSASLTLGQNYTNNHYNDHIRKANPIKISVANDCYTPSVTECYGATWKEENAAFTQC